MVAVKSPLFRGAFDTPFLTPFLGLFVRCQIKFFDTLTPAVNTVKNAFLTLDTYAVNLSIFSVLTIDT